MIITNIQDYISGRSIFEIFEDEFGRPITHKELMTISDMVDKYTEEKVLLALREAMIGFSEGTVKYLVSKPSICGFGMNWQNCNYMVFCGLSDSYEQFYQAIRRCWRFGQKKEVYVYVIISEKEMNVLNNIKRKQSDHERMTREMIKIKSENAINEINNIHTIKSEYNPKVDMKVAEWL